MHRTNGDKAQMLADTVRSSGGWMVIVVHGKELAA